MVFNWEVFLIYLFLFLFFMYAMRWLLSFGYFFRDLFHWISLCSWPRTYWWVLWLFFWKCSHFGFFFFSFCWWIKTVSHIFKASIPLILYSDRGVIDMKQKLFLYSHQNEIWMQLCFVHHMNQFIIMKKNPMKHKWAYKQLLLLVFVGDRHAFLIT